MDELQSYLQVFSVRKSELGLWLRRSSGYPLLIVPNVHDEGSSAFAAGIRNNDIVLRSAGRASWAMDIDDALMLLAFEEDDKNADAVFSLRLCPAVNYSLEFGADRQIQNK